MPVSFPFSSVTSYPPNTQNIVPSKVFAHWRLALANLRAGTANARVLCVGDSTTSGIGSSTASTMPAVKSYPTRLAAYLNSTMTPAAVGLAVPASILSGAADQRWSLGSGWSEVSQFAAGGGACYQGSGGTGALTFTPSPQVACDGFYVYYLGNGGLGTIVCTATGGSAVSVATGSLSGNVYRSLVGAGSAAATNSVTITSSGGSVFIVGIEPVLSSKYQLLVGNAGVGSSTTATWAPAGAGNFSAPAFIKTVAPDLTIISLGINDAAASLSAASYSANIQTLITAAKNSGDVLLCDMPPSSGSALGATAVAFEQSYVAALATLALSNNCAFLSVNGRFGGVYNSALQASDGVHCNDQGYLDWAQALANVIGAP